jgi:hypothetical protein
MKATLMLFPFPSVPFIVGNSHVRKNIVGLGNINYYSNMC